MVERSRPLIALCALLALTGASLSARAEVRAPWDTATPGSPVTLAAGDIRHVDNIAYSGGSDLEFVRRRVTVNGRRVKRNYAIAGALRQPVKVIDITNPERPRLVAEIPCRLNQNDLQVRKGLLIMAADSRSTCRFPGEGNVEFIGFATADISDPRSPKVLGRAEIPQGAHNVTLHPKEPLVYVSNSDLLPPGVVHIWDVSDPVRPKRVLDWDYHPSHPPHDITFNRAGTRAYAASITHTDIFDTTDPRAPSLLATWVDPAINISHQADPTPDGTYLIVSDEIAGALTGPVCPGGGLHVYDVSADVPIKVGTFWADDVGPSGLCTAHVFRINPDGETMAIAWYNAGVHVLDFGDMLKLAAAGSGELTGIGVRTIAAMKMPNADTWSAKMWQRRAPGYVFANDLERGFDVFHVPALAQ